MSNPNNLVILKGDIFSEVQFYYKKGTDIPIYCEFDLKVARNYLNKGEQKYDYPRVKYAKDDLMKLANIKVGSKISLIGAYNSEFYDYEGKKIKKQSVLADNIEVSEFITAPAMPEQIDLPY